MPAGKLELSGAVVSVSNEFRSLRYGSTRYRPNILSHAVKRSRLRRGYRPLIKCRLPLVTPALESAELWLEEACRRPLGGVFGDIPMYGSGNELELSRQNAPVG